MIHARVRTIANSCLVKQLSGFPKSQIDSVVLVATVSLLILCSGCSDSGRSTTGDFGAFIAKRVVDLGGHSPTNSLPRFDATWTLRSDTNGFEAVLPETEFETLAQFLRAVYGEPRFITTNTVGKSGLYRAMEIGVAIHYFDIGKGLTVDCVRAFPGTSDMLKAANPK